MLDSKEIKPVNPKGNQPRIFTGRTDAEVPILQPPDAKNWLIWKRPWCWERLKAGGEGDDRGWGGWIASPTTIIRWLMDMSLNKLRELVMDRETWCAAGHGVTKIGHDWATNCTELNWWLLLNSTDPLGEGDGTPLQYSCLENPMDREVW